MSRRGARTGSSRKPRGRPPGSSVPRLPRGMSVSTFYSYQNELYRQYQQNAEITRQLAAQSAAVPAQPSSSSGVSVLKDRPSLSITPLKPPPNAPIKPPSANSPVKQIPSNSSPISVSVSRKVNAQYKPRKNNPSSPLPATQWTPSGQPFRSPSISIQPILPVQSSIPKSTTQEVSLQHKILSAKKIVSTSSTTLPPTSSNPSSTSLGNTSLPVPLTSNVISITPNTISTAQSALTITPSSVSINPSSSVTITPTSISHATPISITPSTAIAPSQLSYDKTILKKPPELPFHPSNELTVRQISPKPKSSFKIRPQPSGSRKEIVNSISIIPTSKLDQQKVHSGRSLQGTEEKTKLPAKIASIDSSVADALRNFGRSITITATNKKPTIVQDEMSITPVQQPKPKNIKEPCEVIVLDD